MKLTWHKHDLVTYFTSSNTKIVPFTQAFFFSMIFFLDAKKWEHFFFFFDWLKLQMIIWVLLFQAQQNFFHNTCNKYVEFFCVPSNPPLLSISISHHDDFIKSISLCYISLYNYLYKVSAILSLPFLNFKLFNKQVCYLFQKLFPKQIWKKINKQKLQIINKNK